MISRPASPEEKEVIERKGGLRLNVAMKKSVVDKAMFHAFGKRDADNQKLSQSLGHAAMVDCFGHARLKAAKTAGEPFVYICTDLYGNKQPQGNLTNFRVGYKTIPLLVQDPLPVRLHDMKWFTVKAPDLQAKIQAFADDLEALNVERRKTQTTLESMLQNLQAYSSLERTWPEGKKFYKHLPVDYPFRHQVPATLVADLNKSLGI
jgi:hypothetical protein